MPRGGQILRSGRYHLDAAGHLHRWPRRGAVAIVTVRARRVRVFPVPVEICQGGDIALQLPAAFVPDQQPEPCFDAPAVTDLRIAEPVEAPVVVVEAPPPRPRHTPLPKISLRDVPSGMEQLAEHWRGAR